MGEMSQVDSGQGRNGEVIPGGTRRTTWQTLAVLLVMTLVGTLAGLPYILTLQGDALAEMGVPIGAVLASALVQMLLFGGVAAGVGLWLGPRVGLGAPLLRRLVVGDRSAWREWRAALPLALAGGALAAVAIVALEVLLFAPRMGTALAESAAEIAPWQGLLASLYGGIVEEVLLRLGLMTLLVWLVSKVTGAAMDGTRRGAGVAWFGIIVAALLFGIGHLPTVALLLPLTPLVVVRTILLNMLGGLLFGWLYWRRGLLVAMSAHWMADIVLHVIVPLLMG